MTVGLAQGAALQENAVREHLKGCAMDIERLLKAEREEILRIAAKHGARNVRVFGSAARGEAGPGSDVDILVDLEPGRSLFDLGRLLMDLQDLLGCEVDVVTEPALHWYIRDRILREAVLFPGATHAGGQDVSEDDQSEVPRGTY